MCGLVGFGVPFKGLEERLVLGSLICHFWLAVLYNDVKEINSCKDG